MISDFIMTYCNQLSIDYIAILVGLMAACATVIVGIHICDHWTIRKLLQMMDGIDRKNSELEQKHREIRYYAKITRAFSVMTLQPYFAALLFMELIKDAMVDGDGIYCQKGIKGLTNIPKIIKWEIKQKHSVVKTGREKLTMEIFDSVKESEIYRMFKNDVEERINAILKIEQDDTTAK